MRRNHQPERAVQTRSASAGSIAVFHASPWRRRCQGGQPDKSAPGLRQRWASRENTSKAGTADRSGQSRPSAPHASVGGGEAGERVTLLGYPLRKTLSTHPPRGPVWSVGSRVMLVPLSGGASRLRVTIIHRDGRAPRATRERWRPLHPMMAGPAVSGSGWRPEGTDRPGDGCGVGVRRGHGVILTSEFPLTAQEDHCDDRTDECRPCPAAARAAHHAALDLLRQLLNLRCPDGRRGRRALRSDLQLGRVS